MEHPVKIFGREPTLLIATAGSALSILVGFKFDWLDARQAALIVLVLNAILGVANAVAVRPIAPAAFTYLVGAVAALCAAYGLDVGQEMVGSINGLVLSVLMFLTRGQVTPASDPRTIDGTVVE
jgi:hypothetical protein